MKTSSEKSFNVLPFQTNDFWCLATFQPFQTFLLYSVFLCYMQKCDSRSDMQGLRREYAFIKKLILDTDTTQFPISHFSIISKDATYCTFNFNILFGIEQ